METFQQMFITNGFKMEDGDGIKNKFVVNDLYKNEDEKKTNENCNVKNYKLNGDLSSGSQGGCGDEEDDDDDDEENSSSSSSADSDELVIDHDVDNNAVNKTTVKEVEEISNKSTSYNNKVENIINEEQIAEKNLSEYRNIVSNILKRKLCNDITENSEPISDAEKSPEYKKMLLSSSALSSDLLPPQDLFNSDPDDILSIKSNNETSAVIKTHLLTQQPVTNIASLGTSLITNDSSINSIDYSNSDDYSILKEQLTKSGKLYGKNETKQNEGQLTEYAQYLGLQPAVKFKCFKCFESNFSTLAQLKDHQVACFVNPATHRDKAHDMVTTDDISKTTSDLVSDPRETNCVSTSLHPRINTYNEELQQQQQQSTRPDPSTKIRITRKVFLCSACGTYYENWNLFLHMREVHRRHICLLCLGIFPSVDRLIHHLQGKHKLCEKQYETRETLLKSFKDPCYLMCCSCEHVFTEHDNFTKHLCENYMQPCILCGLKATHKPSCKGAVTAAVKNKSKDRDKLTSDINKKKLIINNNIHDVAIKLNNHEQNVNGNIDGGRLISEECNSRVSSVEHNSNSCSSSNKNNIKLNINNNESLNIRNNNNISNSNAKFLNHNDKNNSMYHYDNDKNLNDENRNGYINKNNILPPYCIDKNSLQQYPNTNEQQQAVNQKKLNENLPNQHESDSDDSSNKMEICTSDKEESNSSHHQQHPQNNMLSVNSQNENCANTTTETKSDHSSDEESLGSLSPVHLINNQEEAEPEEEDDDEEESSINDDNQKELKNNNNNRYKQLNGDLHHNHNNNNELLNSTINNAEDNKPLLVPKLKVRIPKVFATPIESEESSTESDDETDAKLTPPHDDEDEDDDEEAQLSANLNNQSIDEVDHHLSNNDSEIKEDNEIENHSEDHNELSKELETDLDTSHPDMISKPVDEFICNKQNDELEKSNETNKSENIDLEESNVDKIILDIPTAGIKDLEEISVAGDDTPTLELLLDQPLDKIAICEFLRVCLKATVPFCLYCNHARKIAVNGKGLALHLIGIHRFSATVDSITAEELLPSTIVSKLKNSLEDLDNIYLNLSTYDSSDKTKMAIYDKIYECFQCRFVTKIHKELYLHNRKMHMKTILLCIMCKLNFYSYSELLCHRCPGILNKLIVIDITFRCCLCSVDNIQSAFRLMVHLRKKHFACDVCLEECFDQSRLSNHVWKHKLHHLCYRCGIAYRNKPDITKHLFWKHGTESVVCKKCLQKKWPHVYHFCIPPTSFICDVCNLSFSRAVSLKVHKRFHSGDAPYPCTEDNCDNKFISRKLLLKHVKSKHTEPLIQTPPTPPPIIKPFLPSPTLDTKPFSDLFIKQEKIEADTEEEHAENAKESNDVTPSDSETLAKKSKKKKSKHNKDTESKNNIIDLMDLPAPNLSESDSSDDSDAERKSILEELKTPLSQIDSLSFVLPVTETNVEEEIKPVPIIDIWENFKTYQASQTQSQSFDDMDDEENYLQPIIHVSQSDHDYCLMYKKLVVEKIVKEDDETDIKEVNVLEEIIKEEKEVITKDNILTRAISPVIETAPKKKTEKSPKKARKSSSDSSSDSSGSSSSSCSCGSNCSCSSSSSGSSSSSSSSDDSDSSSSEGRKQIATRKEQKIEKERLKSENSIKSNNTTAEIIVDVVATTDKSGNIEPGDTSSFIYESDLETEESETDEDFYDEHPQKMANELLAEKRKQLLMQTCMNPYSNSIVENSRPSTPSLPEEVIKEKRVKVKKRKKERKSAKGGIIPPLKLNIPAKLDNFDLNTTPIIPSLKLSISNSNGPSFTPLNPEVYQVPACSTPCNVIPPVVTPLSIKHLSTKGRLSSGTNSESDVSVKRSKRRRIPNKFYGYSSDEESSQSMKTVPPLNLTWKKEDLPSPSFVRQSPLIKAAIKSPALSGYKTTVAEYKKPIFPNIINAAIPILPPVIIRTPPMTQPYIQQQPPQVVEPLRVPAVPVHHINPLVLPLQTSDKSSESSDSDSSEEGALQILQTPINTKTKPTIKIKPPIKPQTVPPIILNSNRIVNSGIEGRGAGGSVAAAAGSRINKSNTTPVTKPNKLVAMQRPPYPQFPILPPAGSRPAREGESVYCYCRCPYDEVSEMIACDGQNCVIEWFHFECVGIMVPPKGKWYCPDCRLKHSLSSDGTPDNITGDS